MADLQLLSEGQPDVLSSMGLGDLAVATIESSPDIVAVYDRERRLVLMSDTLCDLLGVSRERVIGKRTLEAIDESSYLQRTRQTFEILDDMIGRVVETGITHVDDDGSRTTAEGEVRPASIHLLPVRRGSEIVGAVFHVRDLDLAGSLMFRRAAVGMAHVDRTGGVREANDALLALVDAERAEVQDRPFLDLIHPADADRGRLLLEDVLYGIVADRRAELRLRGNGTDRWVLLSAASNQLGAAGPGGACIVVQDITERVALQHDLEMARQRLEALALHDHLTGLPNRVFLTTQLEASRTAATVTGAHTAVLFVDLDDFKVVNDTGGHELGDHLLRLVAARLKSLLRPTDFAARLGGDEFIVCCNDLDSDPAAAHAATAAIAARIVTAMAEPFETAGRTWRIGASVGIALSRAGVVSPEELLRSADADMYRVKAARCHS